MKVRHIRKRTQARIKRQNAFWWDFGSAVRRALEGMRLPDWVDISEDLAAVPASDPRDPQPFTPKVQLWAGTA